MTNIYDLYFSLLFSVLVGGFYFVFQRSFGGRYGCIGSFVGICVSSITEIIVKKYFIEMV